MSLGTLRIDELVIPVEDVRLRDGRVEIQASVGVTADNMATIKGLSPDAMVMVYGEDGCLIVTGQPPGWPVPARLRVGDMITFHYWLDVDGKMTTEMRERHAARP